MVIADGDKVEVDGTTGRVNRAQAGRGEPGPGGAEAGAGRYRLGGRRSPRSRPSASAAPRWDGSPNCSQTGVILPRRGSPSRSRRTGGTGSGRAWTRWIDAALGGLGPGRRARRGRSRRGGAVRAELAGRDIDADLATLIGRRLRGAELALFRDQRPDRCAQLRHRRGLGARPLRRDLRHLPRGVRPGPRARGGPPVLGQPVQRARGRLPAAGQRTHHRDMPMAVGVIELIHARASGVAFSAHPVTGKTDRIVIETSWGWGEAVVQGLVTPDHVEIGKADRRVLRYQVAAKNVVSNFDYAVGRVVETAMPARLVDRRVLDDEQIAAVVDAVLGQAPLWLPRRRGVGPGPPPPRRRARLRRPGPPGHRRRPPGRHPPNGTPPPWRPNTSSGHSAPTKGSHHAKSAATHAGSPRG